MVYSSQKIPWLPLADLFPTELHGQEPSFVSQLRKPDFQRATLSWTPQDCVMLIQSMVERLVVPSIVMWTSPLSTYRYILDGAHRVSVVMAWLTDDWGEKAAAEVAETEEEEEQIKKAASEVREKLRQGVGFFTDLRADYDEFKRISDSGGDALEDLGEQRHQRALFYADYIGKQSNFPVLWVEGDYNRAEQSFLRINNSGQGLSEWEKRVIEYRNSSAMRVIMSVANSSSAEHYWPALSRTDTQREQLASQISEIHDGIRHLRTSLFEPPLGRPFRPGIVPMLGMPNPGGKADLLGELLCVLQGNRGTEAEITALLAGDLGVEESKPIVNNGLQLVTDALDKLSYLTGAAMLSNNRNQNKSLGIIPLLYMYTDAGRYVRSLLYGFAYWLFNGNQEARLARMRIFCGYRAGFEQVLLHHKGDVVALTQRTGSGSEITAQTAQYFHRLLETIIHNAGGISSIGFMQDYKVMVQEVIGKTVADAIEFPEYQATGRVFTSRQKAARLYYTFFDNHARCGICGGFLDLTDAVQHDHVIDYAKGGPTDSANHQLAHPFCNNPQTKQLIADVRAKRLRPELPPFVPR